MKSILGKLAIAAFAAGLATSLYAAPPGKGTGVYRGVTTQQEIQKLKQGDRYALVCTNCKSITMKEVADAKEVEMLCRNGGTVHCDGCKKDYSIKHVGPPSKGFDRTKVTYVNAAGEPCMFIVAMK